jgi:23S rRNA (adenine1618-N6)-methyltransferase
MHPKNPHSTWYQFDTLIEVNPLLSAHAFVNNFNTKTIDFADPEAVFQLNKALLILHYNLKDYALPKGYLCPAVPGRVDYILHIQDILELHQSKPTKKIKGLDVGVGANCIYPILGSQMFNWDMIGVDIHSDAIEAAKQLVSLNPGLEKNITLRYQEKNSNIFIDAITTDEYFDFTMCNPPFYKSEEEAIKGTQRKIANISEGYRDFIQNFRGKSNELSCNGGEALFIKRMIKQSVAYKKQVGVFTTLVSNKSHLNKFYKQLDKLNATHKTIPMNIGNKKSRILAWWFSENTIK